jgi:hypothetical protein
MVKTVYVQRFERLPFVRQYFSSPSSLEPAQTPEDGIIVPNSRQNPKSAIHKRSTTKRTFSSFAMHIDHDKVDGMNGKSKVKSLFDYLNVIK